MNLVNIGPGHIFVKNFWTTEMTPLNKISFHYKQTTALSKEPQWTLCTIVDAQPHVMECHRMTGFTQLGMSSTFQM